MQQFSKTFGHFGLAADHHECRQQRIRSTLAGSEAFPFVFFLRVPEKYTRKIPESPAECNEPQTNIWSREFFASYPFDSRIPIMLNSMCHEEHRDKKKRRIITISVPPTVNAPDQTDDDRRSVGQFIQKSSNGNQKYFTFQSSPTTMAEQCVWQHKRDTIYTHTSFIAAGNLFLYFRLFFFFVCFYLSFLPDRRTIEFRIYHIFRHCQLSIFVYFNGG